MAEHRLSEFTATVTWLGAVPHDPENIRSVARDSLPLTYAGVPGENHEGLTRAACVRVTSRHPERVQREINRSGVGSDRTFHAYPTSHAR